MTANTLGAIGQTWQFSDLLHTQSYWINVVGFSLLNFFWQGLLVGFIAWAFLVLLRKRSAPLRYTFACWVLVVLAMLPIANIVYLANNPTMASGVVKAAASTETAPNDSTVNNSRAGKHDAADTQTTDGSTNGEAAASDAPPIADSPQSESSDNATEEFNDTGSNKPGTGESSKNQVAWLVNTLSPFLPWVVAAWCLGVLFFSIRFWLGFYQIAKTRKSVSPINDKGISDIFARLLESMKVSSAVRLATSSAFAVPTVIGCFKPIVVLPVSSMTGLSAKEIESLLAHELAHVKRYDCLLNVFQMIVETVLFFHPVVWWISNRIRQEREHCCDDAAVEATGDRKTYAIALTNLTCVTLNHEKLSSRHVAAATGGDLKMRIQRILGLNTNGRFLSQWFAIIALVLSASAISVSVVLANSTQQNEAPPVVRPNVESNQDQEDLSLEEQRQRNEKAVADAKAEIAKVKPGNWIAVVDGKVLTEFASLDEADQAAEKVNANAAHRFIYRPGVDDRPVEFALSPWSERPNWVQLGRRFQMNADLTVAANTWVTKGKRVDDERVQIHSLDKGNSFEINQKTVVSGMFLYDITLTESIAEKVGVYRYSTPGIAYLQGWSAKNAHKCQTGFCKAKIPGLDVDLPVLAFVIRREITGSTTKRTGETAIGAIGSSVGTQQEDEVDTSRVRGGLQMDLDITKDAMSDEHDFVVTIRNVSKKDIEIAADFYFEQEADDSVKNYIRRSLVYTTYPKVIPAPYQTAGMARNSEQPTTVIRAGDTLKVEFTSQSTFLHGAANLMPPRDGVYSIRAELTLDVVGGDPVKLFSNMSKIQVGDVQAPPAACTGTINRIYKDTKKAILDIGSADGIKVGEMFVYRRGMFTEWQLEITKVEKGMSTATMRYVNNKGEEVEIEDGDWPSVGNEASFRKKRE